MRSGHRIRATVRPLSTRSSLALLAAFAALSGVTACAGDEAGDDDEGGAFVAARCAIYWARENADQTLDVYVVDQPASDWSDGEGEYDPGPFPLGAGPVGWFAYHTPDGSLTEAALLARTTSGTFTLTVAGIEAGDAVTFVDGTAQAMVDARTNLGTTGTGGTGSFDGVWTDPFAATAADVDWGDGTLHVAFLGSSITLGGSALGGESSYAQCSDQETSAFAPAGPDALRFLRSGTPGKGSR